MILSSQQSFVKDHIHGTFDNPSFAATQKIRTDRERPNR